MASQMHNWRQEAAVRLFNVECLRFFPKLRNSFLFSCFVCTCYVLRAQNMATRRSFCNFWNQQMHVFMDTWFFLFCRHSYTVSDKKTFSPRTPEESWSRTFATQSAWEKIGRDDKKNAIGRKISQALCVSKVLDHDSSGVRGENVFLSLTVQSPTKYYKLKLF